MSFSPQSMCYKTAPKIQVIYNTIIIYSIKISTYVIDFTILVIKLIQCNKSTYYYSKVIKVRFLIRFQNADDFGLWANLSFCVLICKNVPRIPRKYSKWFVFVMIYFPLKRFIHSSTTEFKFIAVQCTFYVHFDVVILYEV